MAASFILPFQPGKQLSICLIADFDQLVAKNRKGLVIPFSYIHPQTAEFIITKVKYVLIMLRILLLLPIIIHISARLPIEILYQRPYVLFVLRFLHRRGGTDISPLLDKICV